MAKSIMKYWHQSRDGADKKLSQCKKSVGIGEPQTHVYTGENKGQAQNNNIVSSDINDPALQQSIKTCNFWIIVVCVMHSSAPSKKQFKTSKSLQLNAE
ncbi:MAG: hypothetical protein Q7T48_23780 [Cellvibrio sp.]|uniref:hypothetical protein n=1 Tax=Cellvibrio sp. TaxID=1965322 RepID=UPI0027248E12|nr:hypothetical protein [Cellvibrio sp.]